MSTAVASVSLQTAVLEQVKWFANTGTVFSVHDVTRSIRTKVSQGELEIPETEVHGSAFRNDIPHTKVKSLFDDLWRTGAFDQYLTLNRQFNGTYFEYTPTLNVSSTQTANVTAAPVTIAVNTSSNVGMANSNPSSPLTVTSAPPVSDDSVKYRIRTYLDNCTNRNFRPTLKQVQSAIKRSSSTGWTCENIRDYVEQELGISVVADPDFVSASQVAVV
jgi:hypothetical protein